MPEKEVKWVKPKRYFINSNNSFGWLLHVHNNYECFCIGMTLDVFSWFRVQEEIVMKRKNWIDECPMGFRFSNLEKKKNTKNLPVEKLLC